MIQIVTFKWNKPGYRSEFGPQQPNILKNMVKRNLQLPHEFVCITDDPTGLDPDIRYIPLWDDYANIVSPMGAAYPSCYRRLKIYDGEFVRQNIGDRFLVLDLDMVIVDDITSLIDIPDDFKIWGDTALNTPYNGSMTLMTAGCRQKVWTDFNPQRAPEITYSMGYIGSDQAWIAACLGTREKKWTKADGVYSFRNEIQYKMSNLPKGAKIVIFHGNIDPWQPQIELTYPWIKEHYR